MNSEERLADIGRACDKLGYRVETIEHDRIVLRHGLTTLTIQSGGASGVDGFTIRAYLQPWTFPYTAPTTEEAQTR